MKNSVTGISREHQIMVFLFSFFFFLCTIQYSECYQSCVCGNSDTTEVNLIKLSGELDQNKNIILAQSLGYHNQGKVTIKGLRPIARFGSHAQIPMSKVKVTVIGYRPNFGSVIIQKPSEEI